MTYPSENPQRRNAESQPHVLDEDAAGAPPFELDTYAIEVEWIEGEGRDRVKQTEMRDITFGDRARELEKVGISRGIRGIDLRGREPRRPGNC